MDVEPIITIARAARESGIPVYTLRRLIDRGLVAHVRLGGMRRVRLSAVLACVQESDPPPRKSTPKPITIAEASRKTGLPYAMLQKLIKKGQVPSVRVKGVRRVWLSAVLACLEECGATPPPAPVCVSTPADGPAEQAFRRAEA